MDVLVIDNYDSFTFNLVHALEAMDARVTVWRNDEYELEDVDAFQKILLSPGPGIPDEAGLLKETIRRYANTKSILGICLGQQAIAEVFGGSLVNLKKPHHGVAAEISIIDPHEPLFDGLSTQIQAGRYHSWTVSTQLPDDILPTAVSRNGEIMALRHDTLDLRGVQFHPESILTPDGRAILKNWLSI
jgi:anthranilate synthase component 2